MRVLGVFIAVLFAISCNTTQPPLEGSKWSVKEINGNSVERHEGDDPEIFSLMFVEEDRIAAMGACNRIMGNYSASEDGTLSIESVGATMMFCPDLNIEEEYIDALEEVTRYSIKRDQLTLSHDKKIVVILERVY